MSSEVSNTTIKTSGTFIVDMNKAEGNLTSESYY